MLKVQRQNFHHAKLPKPGAVGYVVGLSTVNPRRKCIVSHYMRCDNVLPYRRSIHTVWVRFSAFWFEGLLKLTKRLFCYRNM